MMILEIKFSQSVVCVLGFKSEINLYVKRYIKCFVPKKLSTTVFSLFSLDMTTAQRFPKLHLIFSPYHHNGRPSEKLTLPYPAVQ